MPHRFDRTDDEIETDVQKIDVGNGDHYVARENRSFVEHSVESLSQGYFPLQMYG
jgi:hypothetical protein